VEIWYLFIYCYR